MNGFGQGPSHARMQDAVEQAHGRTGRRPRAPFWLVTGLAVLGVGALIAMGLYATLGA